MTRPRCRRNFGEPVIHSRAECDFCEQLAVFHWRDTYPDLLLCADHLELYPEVTKPDGTGSHLTPWTDTEPHNGGSWGA